MSDSFRGGSSSSSRSERPSAAVLRKDFIIDEYQIYEARAAGADAILLIAEILTPQQILDWMILASELNLTVLLEVHEAGTLMRVRSVIGFLTGATACWASTIAT